MWNCTVGLRDSIRSILDGKTLFRGGQVDIGEKENYLHRYSV